MVSTGLKVRTPRALTARLSCFRVRNPLASTLTEYVPGGRGAMVNNPAEDEMRSVATFVAVFVATTFTPGTTAPVLSVTEPEMVPCPAVCAFSATGIAIGNGASRMFNL
jgi:hypothetical protein